MVRSIRQIQQELDTIKETVALSGQELETLYDRYTDSLSESAQKQLILAAYQLCTQIYPEAFVAMSLNQRQKFQQTLRQLGKEIKPLLEQKPTAEELTQEQADLNLIAEMLKNLPLSPSENKSETTGKRTDKSPNSPINSDNLTQDDDLESSAMLLENDDDLIVDELPEFSFEKLQSLASQDTNTPKITEIDLANPHHLVLWHKKIETIIKKTLDDTSKKANKCLQEFSIIPNRLPFKVIELAIQAGEGNSGNNKLRKIPNILSLVVETDKGQKNKKLTATQISLLRLRLSEIEFADARLSSQRNEIRMLLKKVKRLGSLYQEKQQEYKIAEADAAWRSSWYED
jgi:hypothetical protein